MKHLTIIGICVLLLLTSCSEEKIKEKKLEDHKKDLKTLGQPIKIGNSKSPSRNQQSSRTTISATLEREICNDIFAWIDYCGEQNNYDLSAVDGCVDRIFDRLPILYDLTQQQTANVVSKCLS